MPHPAGSLSRAEAIQLAYALTAKAAELSGVRCLAIKGLVADAHALRAERTPADIDILIEPDGFDAVIRQLKGWGWRPRLGDFTDFPAPHHSVTLVHDDWPCDIDAHRRFPGFLASQREVFDALWERREGLPLAGRLVPVTDWAGSVAVMALHAVRSTNRNPRHAAELHHLVALSATWTEAQRADLTAFARATGCVASLEVVWQQLGVAMGSPAEEVPPDELAEWRRKVDGRVPSTRVWLRYLREGGPSGVLSRAWTMLWPPEEYLRAALPIGEGAAALLRARIFRIVRAVSKVPRNALAMTRGGGGVVETACGQHPDSS